MKKSHRILASAIAGALALPALAQDIALKSAFSVTMSHYGQAWTQEEFKVEVPSVSPNQQVYIYREMADGQWQSIPMAYQKPVDENTELWELSINSGQWGDEFVVKMEADGREYWDNNYGANYRYLGDGFVLGKDRPLAVQSYYPVADYKSTNRYLKTKIILDNQGYAKNVQLIYTKDHWASSQTVDASFAGANIVWGYGSYPNPSANNTELWTAQFLMSDTDRIEFYIKYSVNGVDYYDNNGGANYRYGYVKNYPYMNFRNSEFWNSPSAMRLVDDNLWSITMTFPEAHERAFKFDVYGNWAVNFGDDNADHYVEQNGANIAMPSEAGQYRITFNSATGNYKVQRFGL